MHCKRKLNRESVCMERTTFWREDGKKLGFWGKLLRGWGSNIGGCLGNYWGWGQILGDMPHPPGFAALAVSCVQSKRARFPPK